MRRALTYLVVMAALPMSSIAAERKSWNRIRYVGGTVPIRTTPYDWNTTLTVTVKPDAITLTIAPARLFDGSQSVHILASQVISLSAGPVAWRRVGELAGSHLPAKPPSLFGLLQESRFLGIVYQKEDGSRGAVLLDSYFTWQILPILDRLTGKTIEHSP